MVSPPTAIYPYGHTLSLPDALPISWTARHQDGPASPVMAAFEVDPSLAKQRRDDLHGLLESTDRLVPREPVALVFAPVIAGTDPEDHPPSRSEEHTSELQSLMRISYAVLCLKKKKSKQNNPT